MVQGFTTGEVAERARVNVQTVRYYERRGLLPAPHRLPSGYRQYDQAHIARIRFIKRAQELGFTLGEIDELLSLKADPAGDRADVRARAATKVSEIQRKIDDLNRIRHTLLGLLDACEGHGPAHDCPILQALEHDRPEGRQGA